MLNRRPVLFALATLLGVIAGCATLPDPLNVTVAGIEPLQGEGMEVRMLVKLRVQNPNDRDIQFTGAQLELDVFGRNFASGVAPVTGTVPRFGEAIVEVPVTISLLRMARQVLGMIDGKPIDKVTYEMSGKLQTGGLSAIRFSARGEFDVPKGAPAPGGVAP
jgi:LEA14-like dessication related protein